MAGEVKWRPFRSSKVLSMLFARQPDLSPMTSLMSLLEFDIADSASACDPSQNQVVDAIADRRVITS